MKILCNLFSSSVGKKWIVAITGGVMVLFLLGHMVGNLQVFEGRGATPELTKLNEYAALLRKEMALLYVVRAVLLGTVLLHVFTATLLTLQNWAARPVSYQVKKYIRTTVAARTMIYGGIALFGYVTYHILHLTTGNAHAELFVHGDVYQNVVASFQNPWISGVYLVSLGALFLHLLHGISSATETLGVSHPQYVLLAQKGGLALALILTLGFAAVPLAILTGLVS